MPDERTEVAIQLADQIKPLLFGHEPAVQGAALAQLLALWLAGHHPSYVRLAVLKMHADNVRYMVKAMEKENLDV